MKKLLLIPAFMTMFFVGTVAVSAAFAAQPAPPQKSKMMLLPPKDGSIRRCHRVCAGHSFPMQRLRKNCSPHTATVILICCDC